MVFRHFRLLLLARVLFLTVTLAVLVYGVFFRQWYITSACLFVLVGLQVYDLWYFVEKTNREISRLLSSVRHADFTQFFNERERNSSFRQLYTEFNKMIRAFHQVKAEKEAHFLYLQHLVEHISTGILSLTASGQVQLINRAGRELLGVPLLHHVSGLDRISPDLAKTVVELEPGESRLVRLSLRGEQLLLSLRASQLELQGQSLRIVSLQNIRTEMEEQESEAWQKLIRVLTHEVMNSVTPIASLTGSIRTLVTAGLVPNPETGELDAELVTDIQTGLETIEKRSLGMLHFVDRYRQLTRIPKPRLEQVQLRKLFAEVVQLLSADPRTSRVAYKMELSDEELVVEADPELIAQVLLNLVKNAAEACAGTVAPCVEVIATQDGLPASRLRVDVCDNGSGIPADILDKIFVPFYTTKKEGSGIGLPLSRQIMRLHKGTLRVTSTEPGRTVVSMLF